MTTPLEQELKAVEVSASRLAELTGVDLERCSALLSGADPTIDEVRQIAKALRLAARSLITYPPDVSRAAARLRENFKTKDGSNAGEALELLLRAHEFSSVLPARQKLRFRFDVSGVRRNTLLAENLSRLVRLDILKCEELDPIENIEYVIAQHTSARVFIVNMRGIEGSAISVADHDFIFISERGDPRMRFTLAHELCHYLVDLEEEGGWFDEDTSFVGEQQRSSERFANTFAGALLMPARAIGGALAGFRKLNREARGELSDIEIMFLARFFGVNFQVAGRRCEDLQLIPSGAANSLYESVLKRYRSPERFADQIGLPPRQPVVWGVGRDLAIREANTAIRSGEVSIGRLSEALRMSPIDVAAKL